MAVCIDQAICRFLDNRGPETLDALYDALRHGQLLAATAPNVVICDDLPTDVPFNCIRSQAGRVCLPAFTSELHLLEWKPAGPDYIEIPGEQLFQIIVNMTAHVELVLINHMGVPRGELTRKEIEILASGRNPTEKKKGRDVPG